MLLKPFFQRVVHAGLPASSPDAACQIRDFRGFDNPAITPHSALLHAGYLLVEILGNKTLYRLSNMRKRLDNFFIRRDKWNI